MEGKSAFFSLVINNLNIPIERRLSRKGTNRKLFSGGVKEPERNEHKPDK